MILSSAQMPAQDIFEDEGPQIANMSEVVNRGAAGVHPDSLSVLRLEFLLFSCQSVRQF